MTEKAGPQPPEEVMNVEALRRVGGAGGSQWRLRAWQPALEKAEGKRLSLPARCLQ